MTTVATALLTLTLAADAPFVRSQVKTSAAHPHCLWWKAEEIVFRQEITGNSETTGETEFDAVSRAFQTWNTAVADCADIHFREGARTTDRSVGHDFNKPEAENQNAVIFRTVACTSKISQADQCWVDETCMNLYDCWEYSVETIGLTTTTYDRTTGQIYDADVELNAVDYVFTTVSAPKCTKPFWSQNCVATDVQNTVTHEVGHMLGLAHTSRPGSLMYNDAAPGETSKRNIDFGSASGVCETYPKGGVARDCVINPAKAALGNAPGPGCATTDAGPWLLGALLGLGSLRRRRA